MSRPPFQACPGTSAKPSIAIVAPTGVDASGLARSAVGLVDSASWATSVTIRRS